MEKAIMFQLCIENLNILNTTGQHISCPFTVASFSLTLKPVSVQLLRTTKNGGGECLPVYCSLGGLNTCGGRGFSACWVLHCCLMKRQEQSLHRWPRLCYGATVLSPRKGWPVRGLMFWDLSIQPNEGERQWTSVRFFGGSRKCVDAGSPLVISVS